jgi:hypothetical protein
MYNRSRFGHCIRRMTLITAGIVLTLVDLPVLAQMQIPNPLIRPRSITSPARPAAAGPSDLAPGSGQSRPAGAAGAAPAEDPYVRSLTDLKDRFSQFYVSAIVGKEAILRRSAGEKASSSSTPAQPTGTSMAAVPLGTASSGGYARSESLMVSDGELLEMAGNTGALFAKVTNRQVTIYLVQETTILPGGQLQGKRAAVFSGEVQNSGSMQAATIVLERPDPSYKRIINVETKARGTSSPSSSDGGSGSSATPSSPSGTPSP